MTRRLLKISEIGGMFPKVSEDDAKASEDFWNRRNVPEGLWRWREGFWKFLKMKKGSRGCPKITQRLPKITEVYPNLSKLTRIRSERSNPTCEKNLHYWKWLRHNLDRRERLLVVYLLFAPCKGIQASRGFRIPHRGFRIPKGGFRIPCLWIPDSKLFKIPDSKVLKVSWYPKTDHVFEKYTSDIFR